MGTGEAEARTARSRPPKRRSPTRCSTRSASRAPSGVLINITGGPDMTLFELDEAANRIREEVDPDANIIFGSTFDEKLAGTMRVSVVATGIDDEDRQAGELPVARRSMIGAADPFVAPRSRFEKRRRCRSKSLADGRESSHSPVRQHRDQTAGSRSRNRRPAQPRPIARQPPPRPPPAPCRSRQRDPRAATFRRPASAQRRVARRPRRGPPYAHRQQIAGPRPAHRQGLLPRAPTAAKPAGTARALSIGSLINRMAGETRRRRRLWHRPRQQPHRHLL